MSTSHTVLSVENLESRLNLSTLPGFSVPAAVEIPIYAQERAVMADHQVVSLSTIVSESSPAGPSADAVSDSAN